MTQTRSTCNHGRSCALKKRTTVRLAESCSKVHSTSCMRPQRKHAILASARSTEAHTGTSLGHANFDYRPSSTSAERRYALSNPPTPPCISYFHYITRTRLSTSNAHSTRPPPSPRLAPFRHSLNILAPMDCNGGLYAALRLCLNERSTKTCNLQRTVVACRKFCEIDVEACMCNCTSPFACLIKL